MMIMMMTVNDSFVLVTFVFQYTKILYEQQQQQRKRIFQRNKKFNKKSYGGCGKYEGEIDNN